MSCVLKVQIIISFLGTILSFSEFYPGTCYDGHIFNELKETHDFEPWEFLLGDNHNSVCYVLTPIRNPQILILDDVYNTIFQNYRVRVEHNIGYCTNHNIFITQMRSQCEH